MKIETIYAALTAQVTVPFSGGRVSGLAEPPHEGIVALGRLGLLVDK